MNEIRLLSTSDLDALVRIFADAYPGLKIISQEDRQRLKQRVIWLHEEEPTAHFHGLFRQGQLLGIMCFYDFAMNFLGVRIPVGGLGQVAVDLVHKKEHIAKEMTRYFLQHYRQQATPLVALYPFRPDFYRKMGFGYGTKMNQYRVKPSAWPKGRSRGHIRYLSGDDRQALVECYHRVVDRTHGMMEKTRREIVRLFENPQHRIIGYANGGQIRGYLVFSFEPGESFIINDLNIHEFIYESKEVLSELLTFLHTQADQVQHVIVNTQDEFFHHLLLDPRNDSGRLLPSVYHETNSQGLGLMYRLIDVPGIFDTLGERDFGTAEFGTSSWTLKLTIEDSFLPENACSLLLSFEDGHPQRLDTGEHNVEIHLDISDFSSLLAGTVDFYSLYRYGLADISDSDCVKRVNRIFAVEQKPVCTTGF